jgi:hypothetical protein
MYFEDVKFVPVQLKLTRWEKNLYAIQRGENPVRILCCHGGKWKVSPLDGNFDSTRSSAELFRKSLNDRRYEGFASFRQAALSATRDPIYVGGHREAVSCRVVQITAGGVQYRAIEYPSGERVLVEYQPIKSQRLARLARNALDKLLDQI